MSEIYVLRKCIIHIEFVSQAQVNGHAQLLLFLTNWLPSCYLHHKEKNLLFNSIYKCSG